MSRCCRESEEVGEANRRVDYDCSQELEIGVTMSQSTMEMVKGMFVSGGAAKGNTLKNCRSEM